MANRQFTPVLFALEKNVVFLSAKFSVGASGVPTIDALNSKGICSIAQKTLTFTATSATGTGLTAVSSFAGLYVGMAITGSGIPAGTTIVSMNAGAGTMVISQATTTTVVGLTATVTGGYTIQFGTQAGVRLDTYNKLMMIERINDMTGLQGAAATAPSAPVAPAMLLVNNSISTSLIASVTVVFGSYATGAFVASQPASGEIIRMLFVLGNSTAI